MSKHPPSLVVVAAGVMQVPAIETAKRMGLRVIATDWNPNAPGFELADHHVILDIRDAEAHRQWARQHGRAQNIVGAFAGADCAMAVAAITDELGLPGISFEVAVRSNQKTAMKQVWLADGVQTPWAEEADSFEVAKNLVESHGCPVMVKAIDNAASRGIRRIDSIDELPEAYSDACHHSSTGTCLIEEYIEGDEFSVETIMAEGIQKRFGIIDRHFDLPGLPIETGYTNPSRLSLDVQEEIYRVAAHAAQSLGILNGPAKGDMIIARDGRVMILEMAARLSGGFHSQYSTPLALGIEPIKAAMQQAIGQPFDDAWSQPQWSKVSLMRGIMPPIGRITAIEGIDVARNMPGAAHLIVAAEVGDTFAAYRHCAQRAVYGIVLGDTYEEAEERWRQIEAAVTIRVEALSGQ
ncbi:MAG: ATPase [Myxococcales bacterium]|nr:ATPase [Myxococcales bacterium]